MAPSHAFVKRPREATPGSAPIAIEWAISVGLRRLLLKRGSGDVLSPSNLHNGVDAWGGDAVDAAGQA